MQDVIVDKVTDNADVALDAAAQARANEMRLKADPQPLFDLYEDSGGSLAWEFLS